MRALAILIALAFATPASATEDALAQARALYRQMQDRSQCATVLPSANEFRRSPDFNTLAPPARTAVLRAMADCAWELADSSAAIAIARDARANGADWANYMLLQLGIRFDDDAVALEAFNVMAESERETLAAMPWRFAWRTIAAASDVDPSGGEALRIHGMLAALPYAPAEGGNDDALRVDHATLLMAAGQIAQARERLAPITAPNQILLLRVDRRFDPLRGDPAFAARLDIRAAAEADLARMQAVADAGPRELANHLQAAQALRALGRSQEALALLDMHIERAQGQGGYTDTTESLNWLQNERGYILYDLGRADEARAAFGLGIAAGEDGEWNVSQVINFASMLVAENRPRDALEVLRTVGRASIYGDMWVANVRACAAAQLNDAELLATNMAFLRENADENVAAATSAYLCANDLDAAAALYVSRLADPDQRSQALTALQRYQSPPVVLPNTALLRTRLEAVRDRPDVQAAINAVGRIEDVPLQSVYWGDL